MSLDFGHSRYHCGSFWINIGHFGSLQLFVAHCGSFLQIFTYCGLLCPIMVHGVLFLLTAAYFG